MGLLPMKVKTICAVFAVIMLVGCESHDDKPIVDNKTAEAICKAKANLPGGWTTSEVTPEVQKATNLVIKGMEKTAKVKKMLAVHSQIVNGVNYALEFQLENGTIWSAIVYRDPEGKYNITQTPIPGLFCDH
ncbi:cystatin domain-containing protein [Endozoicomonas sp. SCSIO W0465]|uniref:cystatin domain-containing protein n=1 Tax=Endozoicomonas sp. SCSIO W0465 TaxID=2918516 RepID=UPI0035325B75